MGVVNPWEQLTWRGFQFNRRTIAMLEVAEQILGYELTILQGSYHSTTEASAGTHDRGGAVDLAPYDFERKVHVLRAIGFAAWHRLPIPEVWGEHIHAIALDDDSASSGAKDQMSYYRQGLNGLADHGPDNAPRPNPIPSFDYPAWVKEQDEMSAQDVRDLKTYISDQTARVIGVVNARALGDKARDAALAAAIDALPDGNFSKAAVRAVLDRWSDTQPKETP